MFQKIRAVVYHARDIKQAKTWYTNVLGLEPYFSESYTGFNIGGDELGLYPDPQECLAGIDGAVPYWSVTDAANAHHQLVSLGAKPITRVLELEGGIKVAILKDPFGNALGIIENPHFKDRTTQKPMEKVAVFVDVQNVYYTTRDQYNCRFNYKDFWVKATQNRKLVKAIAYAINRDDEKQIQFQNVLRKIGFEVKLKPFLQRPDGSSKGDWDVGIALDVFEYSAKSNVIVLVSGDGDFGMLVDRIKAKFGVSVEVYGVPNLTARSLIDSASKFFPIQQDLLLKQ